MFYWKKAIDVDYFELTEKIELSHKTCKFEVGDRVKVIKHNKIFSKAYTKGWLREIFVIDSLLKINPWRNETKDLNGEKIIGSFSEKELLLSKS